MISSSGFDDTSLPRRRERHLLVGINSRRHLHGAPSLVVAGLRFLPLPEALALMIGASS